MEVLQQQAAALEQEVAAEMQEKRKGAVEQCDEWMRQEAAKLKASRREADMAAHAEQLEAERLRLLHEKRRADVRIQDGGAMVPGSYEGDHLLPPDEGSDPNKQSHTLRKQAATAGVAAGGVGMSLLGLVTMNPLIVIAGIAGAGVSMTALSKTSTGRRWKSGLKEGLRSPSFM